MMQSKIKIMEGQLLFFLDNTESSCTESSSSLPLSDPESQAVIIHSLNKSICAADNEKVRILLSKIDSIECSDWMFYNVCRYCNYDNIKTFIEKGANNWECGMLGACESETAGERMGLMRFLIKKGSNLSFFALKRALRKNDRKLVEFIWVHTHNRIAPSVILNSPQELIVAYICNRRHIPIPLSVKAVEDDIDDNDLCEIHYMRESRMHTIARLRLMVGTFACNDVSWFTCCFVGLCESHQD